MKITLHQLNQSYQALARLANHEFPKEQHKLAYRIARVYKQAKTEIEVLGESLQTLATRCGNTPGERETAPETLRAYEVQAKKFLCETEFEFTWGSPIRFEELRDHVALTPADLAELDWLITAEEEETAKASTA